MDISNTTGHFLLIGSTMSGKTYLAKHLIRCLKFSSVLVFSLIEDTWTDVPNAEFYSYKEWNRDEVLNITFNRWQQELREVGGYLPKAIVFDDYNQVVNTQQDPLYKQLFESARHYNVRLFNLGHTPTAAGLVTRNNCSNIILFPSFNKQTVDHLAQFFLMGNTRLLMENFDKAIHTNRYAAVLITNTTISIIVAPPHHSLMHPKTPSTALSVRPDLHVQTSDARSTYTDVAPQVTSSTHHQSIWDMSKTAINYNINARTNADIEAMHQQNLRQIDYEQEIQIKKLEVNTKLHRKRITTELVSVASAPTPDMVRIKELLAALGGYQRVYSKSDEEIKSLVEFIMHHNGHPNYTYPSMREQIPGLLMQTYNSGTLNPLSNWVVSHVISKFI
jgi:hypothetical protein